MKESNVTYLVLRSRRRITIPLNICDELGIHPGEDLEVEVINGALVARPRKAVALQALRDIQKAFKRSGITESELQEAGRRIRLENKEDICEGKKALKNKKGSLDWETFKKERLGL